MDQLSVAQLTIFYHVIEKMSFSRAAEHLGYAKSYVSAQIKALENQLGMTLIERNTRNLAVTFPGEILYTHAKAIVEECQAALVSIESLQEKPCGLLRITSPSAYAAYILRPLMVTFLKKYPDISIELQTTGKVLDFSKDKLDVAIRLTHTPPEDKIAKLISHYQMVVCASPKYLKAWPKISEPQHLHKHPGLVHMLDNKPWRFREGNRAICVEVKNRLCAHPDIVLQAAQDGLGIAKLPDYVVAEAIAEGQLIPLLENYYEPSTPIYAIYSAQQSIPPRVQVFIQFLQSCFH